MFGVYGSALAMAEPVAPTYRAHGSDRWSEAAQLCERAGDILETFTGRVSKGRPRAHECRVSVGLLLGFKRSRTCFGGLAEVSCHFWYPQALAASYDTTRCFRLLGDRAVRRPTGAVWTG